MITLEDLKEALAEERPLFHDGSSITYEAYKGLRKTTAAQKKMLMAEFPKYTREVHPKLNIIIPCPHCGEEITIQINKTNFLNYIYRELNCELIFSRSFATGMLSYREFESLLYVRKKIAPSDLLLCKSCLKKLYDEINEEYEEFFRNPLRWVNVHSSEEKSWQWSQVKKLYTYPASFTNKNEGWKYCGLQYKNGMLYGAKWEYQFDPNYQNWKDIQDKTIQERSPGKGKDVIYELLKANNREQYTDFAHLKVIELTEKLLDGLVNDVELDSLLSFVVEEITKYFDSSQRLSSRVNVLKFGKYRGYSVHQIIDVDREYITWALKNVSNFGLTKEERKHYMGEEWEYEILPLKKSEKDPAKTSEQEKICEDNGTMTEESPFSFLYEDEASPFGEDDSLGSDGFNNTNILSSDMSGDFPPPDMSGDFPPLPSGDPFAPINNNDSPPF